MSKFSRLMEKVITFQRRKRLPPDETLAWMCCVNPGMLDPGNVWLFDRCIPELPAGAVVEIGSFCGLSLNHIIYLLIKHERNNPVFSADEWLFEGALDGAPVLHDTSIPAVPYRELVIETFRRNITLFSGHRLPHHIAASSDAFFASWDKGEQKIDFFGRSVMMGGPIALAYIDGDHSYEQSLKDFENVDCYLQVGGFVIFDDSADWTSWGSHRAARETAGRKNYEIVDRAPNYCIRKIAP
jgi:hypothetical protein